MGTQSSTFPQNAARTCCCAETDSFESNNDMYYESQKVRNKKARPKAKTQEKTYKLTIEQFEPISIPSKTKQTVQDKIEFISPYWTTLNRITTEDNRYYTKCAYISSLIEKTIKPQTPLPLQLQHDTNDHKNNWQSVHSMAALCQQPLYNLLQNLVDSIQLFPEYNSDKSELCEVIKASLKKLKRAQEKVETNYDGNWLRLVDICRSSIVHHNFKQLYFILLILAQFNENCFGFKVIKLKNRYTKTTDQGWADMTLLIKPCNSAMKAMQNNFGTNVECTEDEEKVLQSLDMDTTADDEKYELVGHICEVQLIHRAMWNKRKDGLFGHKAYGLTRSADSHAIKAANKVGGAMIGNMVNEAIDLRGDVIGTLGANVVVADNRTKMGKKIGDTYMSYI